MISNRMRTGLVVGCLWPVWLISGCGYPEVGPETYELAKSLSRICNLKQTETLSKFREFLAESEQAGTVSASEAELLRAIVELAEEGAWTEAEQKSRRLLLDQNVRR